MKGISNAKTARPGKEATPSNRKAADRSRVTAPVPKGSAGRSSERNRRVEVIGHDPATHEYTVHTIASCEEGVRRGRAAILVATATTAFIVITTLNWKLALAFVLGALLWEGVTRRG